MKSDTVAKYVQCTNPKCLAIGDLKDTEMVYDHRCPLCNGELQRVDGRSHAALLHHSRVPLFPGTWDAKFEQHRQETTVKEFADKPLPEVRAIKDPHPCEKCRWRGTYRG